MKLSSLRFEPALESEYQLAADDRSLRLLRTATLFTLPSVLVFGIWDYQQNPDKIGTTMLVRVAIAASFAIAFWFTFTGLTKYWTAINLFGFGSIIVGTAVVLWILEAFPAGSFAFVLVMLWIPVGVTRLPAVLAVIGAAVFVPLIAMTLAGVEQSFITNMVWWLSGGAIFALGAWVITDQAYRRLFEAERSLSAEQAKTDSLLRNILPAQIADQLKESTEPVANRFDAATVLFADLVGFTKFSMNRDAETIVGLLNDLFSRFDDLVVASGAEKIKTLGDGYMVAAGVPAPVEDHAEVVTRLALAMIDATRFFGAANQVDWRLRIGIHSGPVVAGVIGKHKFAYDLWGDTVNVASRIESIGAPDTVTLSAETAVLLDGALPLERRRTVSLRGHGDQVVHTVSS